MHFDLIYTYIIAIYSTVLLLGDLKYAMDYFYLSMYGVTLMLLLLLQCPVEFDRETMRCGNVRDRSHKPTQQQQWLP